MPNRSTYFEFFLNECQLQQGSGYQISFPDRSNKPLPAIRHLPRKKNQPERAGYVWLISC